MTTDCDSWPPRHWSDGLRFVLTNRLPRSLLTRVMGWLAAIEHPLLVRPVIALWRRWGGLDLSDAARCEFASVRECFTRELRPGARPIDPAPEVLVSPCDAIVGACGEILGGQLFQIKGSPYYFDELVPDPEQRRGLENGRFITLRLTPSMYHRFHAPDDLRLRRIEYVSGDCWNVDPPSLARVARLFCRNTRASVRGTLADGSPLLLVPVAAILVASLRLHVLPMQLCRGYRGARRLEVDRSVRRGEELGWFEHGSTIVLILPASFRLAEGIRVGQRVRMGRPLVQRAAEGRCKPTQITRPSVAKPATKPP